MQNVTAVFQDITYNQSILIQIFNVKSKENEYIFQKFREQNNTKTHSKAEAVCCGPGELLIETLEPLGAVDMNGFRLYGRLLLVSRGKPLLPSTVVRTPTFPVPKGDISFLRC